MVAAIHGVGVTLDRRGKYSRCCEISGEKDWWVSRFPTQINQQGRIDIYAQISVGVISQIMAACAGCLENGHSTADDKCANVRRRAVTAEGGNTDDQGIRQKKVGARGS